MVLVKPVFFVLSSAFSAVSFLNSSLSDTLLFLSSAISASASASFCSVLLGSDTGCGIILGGDAISLFQNCARERVTTILWMYWTLRRTWFEAVRSLQFFTMWQRYTLVVRQYSLTAEPAVAPVPAVA